MTALILFDTIDSIEHEDCEDHPEGHDSKRTTWLDHTTGQPIAWSNLPVGACWYQSCEIGGCPWTNCDGRHAIVRLPGRQAQDLMWRASNCGSPQDREHRCWVVHGELPNITVDKDGLTCTAGAGSIVTPEWHGFIRAGSAVNV
jgi:hypothetical protein